VKTVGIAETIAHDALYARRTARKNSSVSQRSHGRARGRLDDAVKKTGV